MKRIILFNALLIAFVPVAFGVEPEWKWIAGQTETKGWFLSQGVAEVTIVDGQLNAKLFNGESKNDANILQSLKGSVASGKVRVLRTTYGTDVGDETLLGTYANSTMADTIFETIIVNGKWGFVALTRTYEKKKKK